MGLDWVLHKVRPRAGSERRFKQVTRMLEDMEGEARSPELERELDEISVSAFDEIGAPRVGEDPRADEWFRENVYEPAHEDAAAGKGAEGFVEFWSRSLEECLADHAGRYVVELAEERGGLAPVTGMMASSLDFRGKVLRFVEGLPDELVQESYEDHTAEECLDYARRLEGCLPDVEKGSRDSELLEAAVKWLRFWGGKGFGYSAWY